MTNSIALVATASLQAQATELKTVLAASGATVALSPDAAPRAALKWAMDLSKDTARVCVLLDNEGHTAASIITAIDPEISILIWAPDCADSARLVLMLENTRAFLSFAADAPTLASGLMQLMGHNAAAGVRSSEPAAAPVPVPQPPEVENLEALRDRAMLRELELQMAAKKKVSARKEPVQVQQTALDFSIQLRELMTRGRNMALARNHPQVLGVHYIAQLETPFRETLEGWGLGAAAAEDYLSGLHSSEAPTDALLVSDEVFDAVARAKDRARAEDTECVRISDFLAGLLDGPAPSLVDLLDAAGASPAAVRSAVASITLENETCGAPFFKPSSLDQAGFYEFDDAQVQEVASRLKELPAFQKAAERVAEAKPKHAMETSQQTRVDKVGSGSQIAPPAPPPEKPEILRVAGEFPSVDVVEHAADLLLEGQLLAFPTDIMLALTADAANPAAVTNLRNAASLPEEKPVSILINSTAQLKHLVRADLDALEPLLDDLWPGPLTLIFHAAAGLGRHLVSDGKIAIRLPADNLALSILSMLGRPLAVTSWDEDVAGLTGVVSAIITAEEPAASVRTTVVDLTQTPWNILRSGATAPPDVLRFHKPSAT